MRMYGNRLGMRKEDVTKCFEEVMDGWHFHQCYRKRGHGENGLYCKQHAKKYEKTV